MHRGDLDTRGPVAGASSSGGLDGKIAGLYDLEDTLGSGHFAVVKLARHVFTGEKVAVKVIDKTKLDEVSKTHLFQEVRCMKLVQHPNVVRLYEVIDTQTKLYLILELGDGGDLYDLIMKNTRGLGESLGKEYFAQIVRAISYCHGLHVVHRDLKPENVVFFPRLGVLKLTDFGFSNRYCPGQKLQTSCGSLAYSAPEILLGDSYDAPAVDVWSLGVILYMLVCGRAPFHEANDSETLTMIMDCKYSIPQHVSPACKKLIARMLVREPERRATLKQIAEHEWLQDCVGADLPLVQKHRLTEEDQAKIITKMVNGNIATKEEILEALEQDAFNHVTATYYLIGEKNLREKLESDKKGCPKSLPIATQKRQENTAHKTLLAAPKAGQNMLNVPRTPGDGPQSGRIRKCSIVQEEADEDDMPVREELTPPLCSLNRRGSRSEGRLNVVLQERLNEANLTATERDTGIGGIAGVTRITNAENDSNRLRLLSTGFKREAHRPHTAHESFTKWRAVPTHDSPRTTVITEASTIHIPVHTTPPTHQPPKYKTMPSPTRTAPLNEICEEGDAGSSDSASVTPRPVARNFVNRQSASYEQQRRAKFHKSRTASCSSSDASDDDSESRKKRAHKINSTGKPLPPRRDSHDDSSDSQDPSGSGAGAGPGSHTSSGVVARSAPGTNGTPGNSTAGGGAGGGGSGTKQCTGGRRHRAGRRRAGETRLRESQSLNRITEVQEPCQHNIVISTTLTNQTSSVTTSRGRGLGARLLSGWSRRATSEEPVNTTTAATSIPDNKENYKSAVSEKPSRKLRILGKYFQVHKKLCIPLPNLFQRGRLYKAQSCSSLARDRITRAGPEPPHGSHGTLVNGKGRLLRACLGDVNQNLGSSTQHKSIDTDITLETVIMPLMCRIHLKDVSKCCSMC